MRPGPNSPSRSTSTERAPRARYVVAGRRLGRSAGAPGCSTAPTAALPSRAGAGPLSRSVRAHPVLKALAQRVVVVRDDACRRPAARGPASSGGPNQHSVSGSSAASSSSRVERLGGRRAELAQSTLDVALVEALVAEDPVRALPKLRDRRADARLEERRHREVDQSLRRDGAVPRVARLPRGTRRRTCVRDRRLARAEPAGARRETPRGGSRAHARAPPPPARSQCRPPHSRVPARPLPSPRACARASTCCRRPRRRGWRAPPPPQVYQPARTGCSISASSPSRMIQWTAAARERRRARPTPQGGSRARPRPPSWPPARSAAPRTRSGRKPAARPLTPASPPSRSPVAAR